MKDAALTLLKIAAELFPPLARLLSAALASVAPSHPDRPLADEVRAILPVDGSIHAAVRELEAKKGQRP